MINVNKNAHVQKVNHVTISTEIVFVLQDLQARVANIVSSH